MRHRHITLLTLLVAAIAACGGGATGSGPSAAASAVPPSTAPESPAASEAPATPSGSTAAASAGPSVPVLDPELCPPVATDGLHATPDGMLIDGDDAFIAHVEQALDLLADQASAAYTDVVANVALIRQVPSFSGMCYDTGTYRVGEQTAYAPGHPIDRQVVWLAGTIVHDSCHRERFVAGEEPSGRDAELACLADQVVALDGIDALGSFRDYVQMLIDTVDDPNSQYWTSPDRHW